MLAYHTRVHLLIVSARQQQSCCDTNKLHREQAVQTEMGTAACWTSPAFQSQYHSLPNANTFVTVLKIVEQTHPIDLQRWHLGNSD